MSESERNLQEISVSVVNRNSTFDLRQPKRLWYFQKLKEWSDQSRFQLINYVDASRFWLSLFYTIFYLVSGSKIALSIYMLVAYKDEIGHSNINFYIIDSILLFVWVIYSVIRHAYKCIYFDEEKKHIHYYIFLLAISHYLTLDLIDVYILFYNVPNKYSILNTLLYFMYGIFFEDFPILLIVSYISYVICFIGEIIIRTFTCSLYNPWKANYILTVKKDIPTILYKTENFTQKNCVICLKEFKEAAKISQLECHMSHIFHTECLRQWLSYNCCCPICRQPIIKI